MWWSNLVCFFIRQVCLCNNLGATNKKQKVSACLLCRKNIERHGSLALLLLIHEGNLEAYQYHGLMLGVWCPYLLVTWYMLICWGIIRNLRGKVLEKHFVKWNGYIWLQRNSRIHVEEIKTKQMVKRDFQC